MDAFTWYSYTDNPTRILQGDIIFECPILIPPKEFSDDTDLDYQTLNVIVLSQSCDLENNKIDIVLVCHISDIEDFLSKHPMSKDGNKKNRLKAIENLKKGYFHEFHLMETFESGQFKKIVVDFKNVFGVHKEFLQSHLEKFKNRPRLNSPYREHLSQSFARYFMRVGLPHQIDTSEL